MDTEGLFTNIWGPSTWNSFHCITFNYPYEPTNEDKQHYKQYFELIQYVLPCCKCRESVKYFIKHGNTELNDNVMKNRYTLTKWLYNLRQAVNAKLGVEYNVSYEMMCNKYNSYIAKKDLTMEEKVKAYNNMYYSDIPLISYEIALKFSNYANERNIKNYNITIDAWNKVKADIDPDLWVKRKQKCNYLIQLMRIKGIHACEQNGKYMGLPTVESLNLMKYLCSTFNKEELEDMSTKLFQ
jgi:hypothetical protein